MAEATDAVNTPSFGEALRFWTRLGFISFGGPAGQIAIMHRELVETRRWISEERFLHALNFCMLLPGPEAQQLATYIGWLRHGTRGGIAAGVLFVLPGFLLLIAISAVYARLHSLPTIAGILFGLKAAVLAVVLEAVVRIGRRALRNRASWIVAAAAFVAIFALGVPFPVIILAAALTGFALHRLRPQAIMVGTGDTTADEPLANGNNKTSLGYALRVIAVCALLWFGPLVLIVATLGPTHVLAVEGTFFSKMAVVTFGGAYAVLAYVAQEAVGQFHWLSADDMLQGLALAETTPGPLILVLTFVGFLGAYHNAAPFTPLTAGLLGALVTTWVTFVPCFLWIFLGAPHLERLRRQRALSAALAMVTAAVVGVILNLAIWFGMHALFRDGGVDLRALGIAALATLALLRFKAPMLLVLATAAALGWVVTLGG